MSLLGAAFLYAYHNIIYWDRPFSSTVLPTTHSQLQWVREIGLDQWTTTIFKKHNWDISRFLWQHRFLLWSDLMNSRKVFVPTKVFESNYSQSFQWFPANSVTATVIWTRNMLHTLTASLPVGTVSYGRCANNILITLLTDQVGTASAPLCHTSN